MCIREVTRLVSSDAKSSKRRESQKMTKVSMFIVLLPYLLCTRTTAVVHGRGTPIVRSNTTTNECGVTRYYPDETNRLIPNGETTLPGQWPWVVAIFVLINDEFINHFLCDGNLVSTRHVITAAHCLKVGHNDTRETETLYVALGEVSRFNWNAEGVVNREVRSYEIHPDYAHTTSADSDLAILTMFRHVDYNSFIQPICLWSESAPTSVEHVVNKIGYVVGWDLDEEPKLSKGHSRMVKMSIMSEVNCLRSHRAFLDLTSNRTLCAGLQDQVGSSNIGSGSGLVLYNAAANHYELRGIASRKWDSTHSENHIIVYVDLAKYLPWIQQKVYSRR